jgi:hypothetical protein
MRWTDGALAELSDLADRAPAQAAAVVEAIEWLARQPFGSIGRMVRDRGWRYWPVPPQGVFYETMEGELIVHAVEDGRRRRRPW